MDTLTDFSTFVFRAGRQRRTVYRLGSGPAVILMHEIPGITPQVARFARYVAKSGLTVFMPHLFGTPGRPARPAYAAGQLLRACVAGEFRVLAENRSSPVVDWVRALARAAYHEIGGKGVGAV